METDFKILRYESRESTVTCIWELNKGSKCNIESEAGYIAEKQEINKLSQQLTAHCLWNATDNLT